MGCSQSVVSEDMVLSSSRCFCYSKPFFWPARREPYVKDAYVGLCILQSVEKNINLDGPFFVNAMICLNHSSKSLL